MSIPYPAHRLKVLALYYLRARFPEAVLTTELAVLKYGDARLDVAGILPDRFVGIEVKGDGDGPERLERQGWTYGRTVDRLWLLPAPSLYERCKKHRPRGWGLLEVNTDEPVALTQRRRGYPQNQCAEDLLGLPWKTELVAIAKALEVSVNRAESGVHLTQRLAETVPLGRIRRAVCTTFYHRNWAQFTLPGRPPRIVYRPGDPLP